MASNAIHTMPAYLSAHHLVLLTLLHLHSWSLVYLCMTLLHLWSYSFQIFHLCLSCGCFWIANLQWIAGVQAYTGFLCCIGKCIVIIFVVCVIGLPCLYWKSLPVTCGLLSHWLCGWSSSGGIFQGIGVCLGILFLCCYNLFLYWSGFWSWMLLARVLHFWVLIPWKLFSISPQWKAEDFLWDWHLIYLFLGIGALSHCRMP